MKIHKMFTIDQDLVEYFQAKYPHKLSKIVNTYLRGVMRAESSMIFRKAEEQFLNTTKSLTIEDEASYMPCPNCREVVKEEEITADQKCSRCKGGPI